MLTHELSDGVAVLRFDDGRANGASPASIAAIDQALARAEKEASAAVLLGRPGRFSAAALAAGFLDEVVAEGRLEAASLGAARRFAPRSRGAYRATKRKLGGAMLERIRGALQADRASWATP